MKDGGGGSSLRHRAVPAGLAAARVRALPYPRGCTTLRLLQPGGSLHFLRPPPHLRRRLLPAVRIRDGHGGLKLLVHEAEQGQQVLVLLLQGRQLACGVASVRPRRALSAGLRCLLLRVLQPLLRLVGAL